MRKTMIVAGVWLMMLAQGAAAHSFNVVMAVPGDVAARTRADMTAAFLVASEERDGHANEESDGHLGGLDVYFTLAAVDQAARIRAADPDIVSLPLGGDAAMGDAVVLDRFAAGSPVIAGFLAQAADPGMAPFTNRFTARYGRAPGAEAVAAYAAARQIDLAVRALGGVEDRTALKKLLDAR